MADNVTFQSSTPATPAAGVKVAADEVPYSGDTTQVQIVQLAGVTGAEGSRALEKVDATSANGLEVDVTRSALPSGAATAANQATLIGHVDTLEAGITALLAELGQKTEPADTQPISHAALTELAAAIDTEVQVDIVGSLPAGTNAIGKLAANDGVDIGDVTVNGGNVASGAADSGNPVKVGGRYNSTPPTLTDGQRGDFQLDASGNHKVTLATRLDSAQDSVAALGNVGHDAVDSGAAVKIGFRADSTFQAAVADGDRVDGLADVYGVQRVRDDHPNRWSYHEDSSSALTDTVVQAAPGAGLSIYITDILVSIGAATAFNFFLEEGATKVLGPVYIEGAVGRGVVIQFKQPKKITADTALTITTNTGILHAIDIQGYIAP